MKQGHGNDLDPQQLKWALDFAKLNAGNGAQGRAAVEYVGKRAANYSEGFLVAVHGQRGLLTNVERANVVESENVIGVAVGQQNGVETLKSHAKGLLAKIRSGIDDI